MLLLKQISMRYFEDTMPTTKPKQQEQILGPVKLESMTSQEKLRTLLEMQPVDRARAIRWLPEKDQQTVLDKMKEDNQSDFEATERAMKESRFYLLFTEREYTILGLWRGAVATIGPYTDGTKTRYGLIPHDSSAPAHAVLFAEPYEHDGVKKWALKVRLADKTAITTAHMWPTNTKPHTDVMNSAVADASVGCEAETKVNKTKGKDITLTNGKEETRKTRFAVPKKAKITFKCDRPGYYTTIYCFELSPKYNTSKKEFKDKTLTKMVATYFKDDSFQFGQTTASVGKDNTKQSHNAQKQTDQEIGTLAQKDNTESGQTAASVNKQNAKRSHNAEAMSNETASLPMKDFYNLLNKRQKTT